MVHPRKARYEVVNLRTGKPRRGNVNSPPSCRLTVVIPAFKEELRISGMLRDTIGYLEDRGRAESTFTSEVLVVDDGSPDKTLAVVKGIYRELKPKTVEVGLICFFENQGKGAAISEVVTLCCSRV